MWSDTHVQQQAGITTWKHYVFLFNLDTDWNKIKGSLHSETVRLNCFLVSSMVQSCFIPDGMWVSGLEYDFFFFFHGLTLAVFLETAKAQSVEAELISIHREEVSQLKKLVAQKEDDLHRTVQKYEQVLQVLSKDGATKYLPFWIRPNVYHGHRQLTPLTIWRLLLLADTFPSSGSHLCWQIPNPCQMNPIPLHLHQRCFKKCLANCSNHLSITLSILFQL